MSEFWIRFTDDERIEGPFSVAELKKLASRGYLGPVDKIGNAYSGPWKTAGNIPRLGIAAPLEKEIDSDSIPKQKPPNDELLSNVVFREVVSGDDFGLNCVDL